MSKKPLLHPYEVCKMYEILLYLWYLICDTNTHHSYFSQSKVRHLLKICAQAFNNPDNKIVHLDNKIVQAHKYITFWTTPEYIYK